MSAEMASMVNSSRESCTCERCVALCRYVPGCFMPGEAERAAELLGLPFDAFARQSLAISEISDTDVLGLRPKTVGRNRCVFLTPLGRCAIHAAKPFECAAAWCGDGWIERSDAAYHKVARAWQLSEHQQQLVQIRGLVR